ncbi:MAG: ATPase [Armatimonadetes bacterium]|nr:ATPase [Armatimonadota bacterium]
MSFWVGVDGGGTKTAAVVTDSNGVIMGRGESGAANMAVLPEDAVTASLQAAIGAALEDAGRGWPDIAAAGFGLAGCHPVRNSETAHRVFGRICENVPYAFNHDAAVALIAGNGEDYGIVVIAGTGSIAYGKNGNGEEARAGGWGPLLGDEGSAYDIALRAMRACIYGHDGRDHPTALQEALFRHLNLRDLWQFVHLVHRESFGRSEIAALAPVVAEVARSGDAPAREIFRQAGSHLAALALAVIKRLGMDGEMFPLATVGGVFQAGDLFMEDFTERVREAAPHARIHPPRYEPAVGAALMAKARFGG